MCRPKQSTGGGLVVFRLEAHVKKSLKRAALSGMPALSLFLSEVSLDEFEATLTEEEQSELAFHTAEVVGDVVAFMKAESVGAAWSRLCRQMEHHWPYHQREARRLLRKAERRKRARTRPSTG